MLVGSVLPVVQPSSIVAATTCRLGPGLGEGPTVTGGSLPFAHGLLVMAAGHARVPQPLNYVGLTGHRSASR